MSPADKISVHGVSKSYTSGGLRACEGLDFSARTGEFLCILGPSGCGKTTLLRMLAGLLKPTSGEIVVRTETSGRPASCMVFQDLALFPWMTVMENVSLGLKYQGVPPLKREPAAAAFIRAARLAGFEGYYPHQLSGGMRQRVALARAFATDSEVLLLDEPFGALDACTRRLLQDELLGLWEKSRKTVVLVTHSIEEAVLLSDRILLLTARPGRIKSAFEVPFSRPRSRELCSDPRYTRLLQELWGALEAEVGRSLEEAALP